MTFLPIVERELRVAARRPGLYRTRWYAAMGTILVWLLLLCFGRHTSSAELSQNLFVTLGILALAFCLLAGIFLTADCLSEEKRDGTLGLLFLTDLRGYDVVLGKLIATSVHSAYALLAIFPVLALPLLMGGVTGGELGRVVAVLAVTLFLSLIVGMFVSAITREARHAMGGTFLGMLLLAGALPAAWYLADMLISTKPPTALLWPSPVNAFMTALDSNYRMGTGTRDFWCSLQTVGGLGLGLLVVAAFLLPRSWREKRDCGSADGGRLPSGDPTRSAEGFRQLRRSLESNPYFWLSSRARRRDVLAGILLALLGLLWLCSLLMSTALDAKRPASEAFAVCFFTAYGLHQLAKYLMAVEATRQLGDDRRSGALELLLVTPLRESQILAGQRRALQQRGLVSGVVLLLVNLCLCFLVGTNPRELHLNSEDQALFTELFLGGVVSLFFDLRALHAVGMWMALRARKHQRAVLGTLGRVMVVPWAGILLWVFLSATNAVNPSEGELGIIFALWFAIGIINDLLVSAQARARLGRGIRYWVTESKTADHAPFPALRSSIAKGVYA